MLIQNASWIRMKDAASTVVPVFRKQFETSKEIRSAGLEVTCDGVYEVVLNGKRVGEFILAPGWTEYRKRLQVQTYDITPLLCGSNTLDITVGNGWFRRTNAPWTKTKNPDEFLPAMLIAVIHTMYEDGTEAVIPTDRSWQVSESTITLSGAGKALSLQIFPHSEKRMGFRFRPEHDRLYVFRDGCSCRGKTEHFYR